MMKTSIVFTVLLLPCIAFAETEVRTYTDNDGVIHVGAKAVDPPAGATVRVIKKSGDAAITTVPGNTSDGKCSVQRLNIKEIEQSSGYITVSFKTEVQNTGRTGSCYITLQGIDSGGYELLTHTQIDNIDAESYKTLSDSRLFDMAKYTQVREWKVKSLSKGRPRG